MKSFTDIFIKHPVLAIVVNLMLLLVGIRAAQLLPIQQFPKLESTSIEITTVYIGASAESTRGFLTTPIEKAVSSIAGIDFMDSVSVAGISKITIHLKLNYSSTAALAEINARLQQVRRELPAESEPSVVSIQRADRPYASFYLSFTSDQFDLAGLTDFLNRDVQPQLTTIEGVQRVGVEGGRTPAMRIWISPERLSELNLSPGDVTGALRRNNYLAAIGRVKNDSVQVDLLTDTDLKTVDEFKELIVWQKDGAVIRLGDVATVEMGSEESQMMAMYRGREAVYVSVWPLPGTNEIAVAERLQEAMDKLRPNLPGHVDMQLAFDATKFMRDALKEISKTLVETIAIVGIVVFVFMGSLRTAIVPLVAMPVSLVGATICMYLMGFSLNLLTLLAIVLSVGLVVDDAIVVVENVQRHIREGHSKIQSALIGARELFGPIIAMTITLAVVYAPIGFQGGLTGMLFREFAFTLASAVVLSGIVAVTLSPIMSAKMLSASGKEGILTRFVNMLFDRIQVFYGAVLEQALGLRWAIAFSTLVVGLAAIPLYQFSGKELAPVEDQGAIAVILQASPDATLNSTKQWATQLGKQFDAMPETDYMWALVGSNSGFGGVITHDWHERQKLGQRSTADMIGETFGLASVVPGLKPLPILIPPLPVASNFDVEMVLKSDLPVERLLEIGNEISSKATEAGMFMFVDIDLKIDLPQAQVIIDRERVADMKLDLAGIAQELGVLLGGGYVNRFNYFNRSYQVIPQLSEADRQSTSSLMDIKIRTPNGQLIPVSSFAKILPLTAPRVLNRFQQQGAIRINAAMLPGLTKETGLNAMEQIVLGVAGEGSLIDYAGESRQIRKEGSTLTVTLGIAIALIYLVLAAQFKSFRDPLIVLMGSVPLAISGALALTFLGLTTINIYSQVGLITLVGLVAKNGILIVEFANHLQEQGRTKWRAAIEASQTRLRPVLMTSAATILGHMPLVFVTGPGAQARNSIGIVLVAGMGIGTLFTLFVVPSLYVLIAGAHTKHEEEAA
ncbi:MAG: efflux RND transporter permease subunit [Planctomycetota bacterium]|nr:efflux RND transporter permease subunit [Planctomycetota bacterium]